MTPSEPAEITRAILSTVALADRERRARVMVRQLARWAPIAAGVVAILAALGRWFGWRPLLPLSLLGVLAIAGLVFAVIVRRARATSDLTAARVDHDAQLGGELRSAHWFASQSETAEWPQFHLQRAAARVGNVSWREVYPPVRANRNWAVTGLFCAAALTLALRPAGPGAKINVSGTMAKGQTDDAPGVVLPPDVAKRLQELLADAAAGKLQPTDAKKLAELDAMLKKLDPKANPDIAELLKKLQAAAKDAKEGKANSDLARGDTPPPDDLKQAMDELASKLGDKSSPQDKGGQASPNGDEQQFGKSQAQSKNASQQGQVEMTMQMVREATEQSEAQPMMAGGAQGGDSMSGKGGGKNPQNQPSKGELLKAETLKKELVEANQDIQGQNVTKEDLRRKTEQGKSALSFTHVAAAANVDRSKAVPPPPVPDARKTLVQSYFIRKQ